MLLPHFLVLSWGGLRLARVAAEPGTKPCEPLARAECTQFCDLMVDILTPHLTAAIAAYMPKR